MTSKLGPLLLAVLAAALVIGSAVGTVNAQDMGGDALGAKAKLTPLAQQDASGLEGPLAWIAHEASVSEPVTHSHERSFIYAADGATTFSVDGNTFTLEEGQAGWVSEDATHTHSSGSFWEIRLTAPGTGAPEGLEDAERVFESETLQGLPEGNAQLKLVLVEVPTGGQTSVHTHPGPEFIYVTRGDIDYENAIIGSKEMGVGDSATLPENTAVQKRNPEGEQAAFLTLFVVDPSVPLAPEATFGQMPDDMPETGAGGLSGSAGTIPMYGLSLAAIIISTLMMVRVRRM